MLSTLFPWITVAPPADAANIYNSLTCLIKIIIIIISSSSSFQYLFTRDLSGHLRVPFRDQVHQKPEVFGPEMWEALVLVQRNSQPVTTVTDVLPMNFGCYQVAPALKGCRLSEEDGPTPPIGGFLLP